MCLLSEFRLRVQQGSLLIFLQCITLHPSLIWMNGMCNWRGWWWRQWRPYMQPSSAHLLHDKQRSCQMCESSSYECVGPFIHSSQYLTAFKNKITHCHLSRLYLHSHPAWVSLEWCLRHEATAKLQKVKSQEIFKSRLTHLKMKIVPWGCCQSHIFGYMTSG